MPRWLAVPVTLVLFTAVMLALGWVLRRVVPGFSLWMGGALSEAGANLLVAAAILAAAVYGWWPRDASGRMRPLLPRRR